MMKNNFTSANAHINLEKWIATVYVTISTCFFSFSDFCHFFLTILSTPQSHYHKNDKGLTLVFFIPVDLLRKTGSKSKLSPLVYYLQIDGTGKDTSGHLFNDLMATSVISMQFNNTLERRKR